MTNKKIYYELLLTKSLLRLRAKCQNCPLPQMAGVIQWFGYWLLMQKVPGSSLLSPRAHLEIYFQGVYVWRAGFVGIKWGLGPFYLDLIPNRVFGSCNIITMCKLCDLAIQAMLSFGVGKLVPAVCRREGEEGCALRSISRWLTVSQNKCFTLGSAWLR